MAIVNILIRL